MSIYDELGQVDHFNDLRIKFLNRIAETHLPMGAGSSRPSLIVVTHLLPDRPALLTVLGKHFDLGHVFGIPYSTDRRVVKWTARHFPVSEPTLQELVSGNCLQRKLISSIAEKIILLDIGGYGAPLINNVGEKLGERLIGIVEGTKSGTLRYSSTGPHNYPVICMSLSPIKDAESALVGSSCLFSVERILRELGFANELRTAVVLGYGRVGKSVAEACRTRGLRVYVFDTEAERRIQALAEGFLIPERSTALAQADVVLAATGQRSWNEEDVQMMRDGVFLVSCSSKDVEFDFATIQKRYAVKKLGNWVHTAIIDGKHLHFVYEGRPVNFSDGANLGPLLTLIQGEMVAVCGDLLSQRYSPGVQGPIPDTRKTVIQEWFDCYLDTGLGWFRTRTVI